ncbi:DUF3885 domain-containing protein [Brevibacillus gelatini]|uniref:DUF3885 domain-containing protein n=1 Tax=Brevibacillus gelatini TaxID=1655277 RepID=A0A3M8AHU2_9BACL|nr:DUF3885 domain-containing protein [Brevibacillus gelatini]RNB50740.1 DUF3885 domain-containing protein [Brevibacillus gelatini]
MDFNVELNQYLSMTFSNLELKKPLFYNARIGIRFELGANLSDFNKRMEQIYYRTSALFRKLNENNHEIYLVVFLDSWDDEPISVNELLLLNYLKKYIDSEELMGKVSKLKVPYRYPDLDDDCKTETYRYCLKCKVDNIDVSNLLEALANQYVGIQPSFIGDVYVVNSTNNTIFHMYDDRGVDIISHRKETIQELYKDFNDWILDYDREKIDSIFQRD